MNNSHKVLNERLKKIGLTEKESLVYLSLLELGQAPVTVITRKAAIPRTTGYVILDGLVNKGLVGISGKKPKEEYLAESPDKIKTMLERDIAEKSESLQAVESFIPELKSIHNQKKRPQVRFYEGKEGLMEVYEDTLTAEEPILAYASVEDTQGTLPNYFPKYYKRRAAKGIAIRAIFPKTSDALELVKHNEEEKRDTALVPAEVYNFTPEINIYNNKVMIASWREKLGIILESQEVADAMKKIFELAWAEAKRLEASSK